MDNHKKIVNNISAIVRKARVTGAQIKIYHGSTNSTRQQKFRKNETVNISKLDKVLKVDELNKTISVEPKVNMKQLLEATFKYGLIPQVVMEFPDITVGGGIAGISGESSSFKFGGFHEGAIEYEVVLGNGEIVIVSKRRNKDLFEALPGSYGTLGVITSIKLNLVPAKPYVKLKYISTTSMKETKQKTTEYSKTDVDFIDAVQLSPKLGVVMVGTFSDRDNLPVKHLGHWWNDWFYLHARRNVENYEAHEELIPLREYLFRYDRAAFWAGSFVFKRFRIPFNRFTRLLFSRVMRTKTLYRGLRVTNISQEYLIQDYCLPSDNFEKMYQAIDKQLGFYPLWVLAIKPGDKSFLSSGYIKTNLIFNVGAYGKLPASPGKAIKINIRFEKLLQKLGGRKVFYAHSYYSEKDFWDIYDRKQYDHIREKYFASTIFPNIYDKIVVTSTYQTSVILGIIKFILPPYRHLTIDGQTK